MVAVIKTGSSLRRIVNYNEQKVNARVAECILAMNYPKDVELLTLQNKVNRLLNQAALNENVTRNSVHISLNFDPSENLTHDKLKEIAVVYMKKIGFGEQPYLVYQHHDAGHPHIHLVTLKVRADGSRIDMQNIGRNQSEKARREIEQAFNLVKAEESKKRQNYELKPIAIQKVQYGRSETKRAITVVLDAILQNYKYTSLPELNAVLKQYNISADGGGESSRIYQHKGLTYQILDENGNRVGVPIKASDFYNKPTLKYLEERFKNNEISRHPHKSRVKTVIDLLLLKNPNTSLASLLKALEKEGIHTIQQKNADGLVYGFTYIDHRTKCVFKGSDLGKSYSAKGIQERCTQDEIWRREQGLELLEIKRNSAAITTLPEAMNKVPTPNKSTRILETATPAKSGTGQVLDTLLKSDPTSDYIPAPLNKNSRRKRKKRINNHQ